MCMYVYNFRCKLLIFTSSFFQKSFLCKDKSKCHGVVSCNREFTCSVYCVLVLTQPPVLHTTSNEYGVKASATD